MTTDQAKHALDQIRAGFEALGFETRAEQLPSGPGFRIPSASGWAFGVELRRDRGVIVCFHMSGPAYVLLDGKIEEHEVWHEIRARAAAKDRGPD